MRKISILVIIIFLLEFGVQNVWAGDSFNFPKRIKFKLLKSDRIMGSCRLDYTKKADYKGTSRLTLKNFEGFGLTSQEWLLTYIFSHDSSIYATFLMKNKIKFSEIRLKEGVGFDGKKGKVFVYRKLDTPDEMQTELFTKYLVIDLVSSLFVTSQRVATGKYKDVQKFNFFFGKSTKIMDMMYIGKEKAPFQGKEVDAHVLTIRYNNVEMFRLKIFKDKDGYCFPVSVTVVTDFSGNNQESFEMRADKVFKK